MQDLISIAKILNFHGIKGEAKVGFSKGKENQISNLKKVVIKEQTFKVKAVRFHKQFAIIKFEGINSIDELMEYKGENIYIPKEIIENSLDEDEFLIDDLIGMMVFDNTDEMIGLVDSVSSNGGGDILCIKPENPDYEQFLIPFVKELVPIVDVKKKKIIIKPIEGLYEI